jgi:hypothetical protein
MDVCPNLPCPHYDDWLGNLQYQFLDAFVQAKLKEPIWIHLPRGFRTASPAKTCLRLIRSQYGISEAP